RAAHLAQRGAGLQSLPQHRQQVAGPRSRLADLFEAAVDERLITVRLERLQPLDLLALRLGIDAQDVGNLDLAVLDELVHPDDDVLSRAVALVVPERRLLDLSLDEVDRVDRSSELVDLGDQL